MPFSFGNSPYQSPFGQSPFEAAGARTQSPWQTTTLGPTPMQPIIIPNPVQTSGQPYGPFNHSVYGGQMPFQGPFPQMNSGFVPNGVQTTQFHSQGSHGPLTTALGESSLAMDHLRRSGINNYVGIPQGQAQLFYPNSNDYGFGQQQTRFQAQQPYFPNGSGPRWPETLSQGQQQTGFPMVSGKFALIDTGALSKLLQDHARSVPVQRPLNRFDSLRAELSRPSHNPLGYGPFHHVSPQRDPRHKPVDWFQGQGQPFQGNPLLRPVDWTQGQAQGQTSTSQQPGYEPTRLQGIRLGQEYYVDLVRDVGQFRRNPPTQWSGGSTNTNRSVPITFPRDAQRGAAYGSHFNEECDAHGVGKFYRPGQSFSFKPAPQTVQVETPNWKKLNLKTVNSMIDPMDEPLINIGQRRTFSDYGRQYHHNPPKRVAVSSGPPRQSGASSFSNLVQARIGVPVPFPIRNLSFKPQRDVEYVANLSHRVPIRNMALQNNVNPTTFNPFLPEDPPVDLPQDAGAGHVEIKELYRKAKPLLPSRIPILKRNTEEVKDDDGWVPVLQVNQIPRRPTHTLDIGNSSILENAVTFNVNPLEGRQGNRTRSRRARSKMTYSTQERNRCGVTLTRDQYYCRPDIDELDALMDDDGHCFVTNFEVGHLEWGKVIFEGTFDVAGINLDTAITIEHKAVILYRDTDDEEFPPIGQGLNRPATVYLTKVWYNNPVTKQEIRDPSKLQAMNFVQTLKDSVKDSEAQSVTYDPEKGEWSFKVPYFVPIAAKLPSSKHESGGDLQTSI